MRFACDFAGTLRFQIAQLYLSESTVVYKNIACINNYVANYFLDWLQLQLHK